MTGTISDPRSPRPRPPSAVSTATGAVGMAALAVMLLIEARVGFSLAMALPLFLVGTALPMIVWSVVVEKVHRRPSTGLVFARRRPTPEVLDITVTKFAGLLATFALIGLWYFAIKSYQHPQHVPYFLVLSLALPVVLPVSAIYIFLTTRHMTEPRDELWHFGSLVLLRLRDVDPAMIKAHLLAWAVKAFFLAFMAAILPLSLRGILAFDHGQMFEAAVPTFVYLIQVAFFFDVCFGTIGYILTFRVLDAQIRSANPYLAGWVLALICYPPFALVGSGKPLNYLEGTQEWMVWLESHGGLLALWGTALVVLATLYAWATVVFGLRFSNLTHRGILTHGPFALVKHPAYLSKNLFWWMAHMPFLSTLGATDAARNCLLLLVVNLIYFGRARTEEWHLREDPAYREYEAWIAEAGLFARLRRRLRRR